MDLMAFMEQMGTSDVALVAAFFIGLMMAISPCPLATNITAIAYISKKIGEGSKKTLLVGLVYTLGRAFTYVAIAYLIVYLGMNVQSIALFLQEYGEKILGPLLITLGAVMLEIVNFNFMKGSSRFDNLRAGLSEKGYLGAFLLGVFFALTFCPFSAVLYFGMLIPLALRMNDPLLIPGVFAIATGLPVIIASVLLVKSVSLLGNAMKKTQVFERFMRKIVGAVFILAGVYYIYFAFL